MGEPACLALGERPQPGAPPRQCSPWQQVWVVAESLASGMGLLIGILIPPNLSCNVWLATQALVLEQVICLIHRNTSPLNWKELYCFVEDLLCLKKNQKVQTSMLNKRKISQLDHLCITVCIYLSRLALCYTGVTMVEVWLI